MLCEVARRLNEAVRGDDLVVRWGGEEFLVLALKVPAAQAEQMAARVLKLIGDTPVMVQGQPVQVTVSIGYARFPLPPNVLPVAWEQAINLADMALYTAKSQGRNRAVGIVAAQAPAAPELRQIEADFDRAWHEGRVTLKVAPGPVALALTAPGLLHIVLGVACGVQRSCHRFDSSTPSEAVTAPAGEGVG